MLIYHRDTSFFWEVLGLPLMALNGHWKMLGNSDLVLSVHLPHAPTAWFRCRLRHAFLDGGQSQVDVRYSMRAGEKLGEAEA